MSEPKTAAKRRPVQPGERAGVSQIAGYCCHAARITHLHAAEGARTPTPILVADHDGAECQRANTSADMDGLLDATDWRARQRTSAN